MSIGTEFRKKTADSYPSQRLAKRPVFPALLRKLARRWLARPRKPLGDLIQSPP
jgi:hypothetical protein